MLLLVVLLVVAFAMTVKVLTKRTVKGVPTVQGGLPFFGHVFTMLRGSPWDTMALWAREYGGIYKVHLFGSDAIFVSDPALLKVVLQTKLNTFKKDLVWTYKPFLVLLGNGLVTSDGKSWLRQRALLATHLKMGILTEIPPLALRAVHRFMAKLDAAKATGSVLEMAEEFRHLTLQVISEAVLSISAEESDKTFARMYLPIVQEGNLRTWSPHRMYLPTPSWFKFRNDVATLNNYVTNHIETRWEQLKTKMLDTPRDVLDKILMSYSEEEWGRDAINQIRDEIKTFILAGHETSASMLAWAIYELTLPNNRDKLQRLRAEAVEVFAEHLNSSGRVSSLPPLDQLNKLVYSECCLRESLRKYSVVPTVVRLAAEDVDLNEYFIPKGSTIMVCIQGVHHNSEFWPEPLKYQPERFLGPVAPYTFLPFIEGPRMCLGQFLALLETKIVLSCIAMEYDFELMNPDDAGTKHPYMVPIIPAVGHFMKIRSRKEVWMNSVE